MEAQTTAYPPIGAMVEGYDYDAPITFNSHGWIASGQFPADCVDSCSASGSVDDAVAHWVSKLGLVTALEPHRNLVERYLCEFGAWDDLATADMSTLAERVLWIACGDIRESGEWLGIVH